jgi:hypothetical protein
MSEEEFVPEWPLKVGQKIYVDSFYSDDCPFRHQGGIATISSLRGRFGGGTVSEVSGYEFGYSTRESFLDEQRKLKERFGNQKAKDLPRKSFSDYLF